MYICKARFYTINRDTTFYYLTSAQGNTESLQANVDKAYEQGNTEMSVLKKPFRIELRKTAVVASYRARVIGVSRMLCVYKYMYV